MVDYNRLDIFPQRKNILFRGNTFIFDSNSGNYCLLYMPDDKVMASLLYYQKILLNEVKKDMLVTEVVPDKVKTFVIQGTEIWFKER